MGQRAREVEDTSFQNLTRPRRAQGSTARPSPRWDSIHSKDARPEPPGGVQVKPISVNSPTRLSAQITRAPNVPFPGIWFPSPPPTPSHSVKIQKSLGRASSPPSTGRDGLSDSQLEPPRPSANPQMETFAEPRLPPRIRLSLHLGLPGSPKPEIHSLRQGFDLPTLPESGEASGFAAPCPPPPRSRKPYKTGSETVSRYHRLCQESQTLLTSSLFFPQAKSLI